MPSNTHEGVKHAKFMQTSYISLQELLHPTVASWPFEVWGIDAVEPISPSSTRGHRFILAMTDYFSKWTEAIPLVEVKTSNVVNFIKHHIIHRFGVPRRIILDNGPQFVSQVFYQFCDKYQIQNVLQLLIIPPLMAWRKHSTRQSLSYKKVYLLE